MVNIEQSKEFKELLQNIAVLIEQKWFSSRGKKLHKFLEKNHYEPSFYRFLKNYPTNKYPDDKNSLIHLSQAYITNLFEDSIDHLEFLPMYQTEGQVELYELAQSKIGKLRRRYKSVLSIVKEAFEISADLYQHVEEEKSDKSFYHIKAPKDIITKNDLKKIEDIFETSIHWKIYNDCSRFFDIYEIPDTNKGSHGLRPIKIGGSETIWWQNVSKGYSEIFFYAGFDIVESSEFIVKLLMLTGIDKILAKKENSFLSETIENYKNKQNKVKKEKYSIKEKTKSNFIPSSNTIESFLEKNSLYKSNR